MKKREPRKSRWLAEGHKAGYCHSRGLAANPPLFHHIQALTLKGTNIINNRAGMPGTLLEALHLFPTLREGFPKTAIPINAFY